ncbi:MAG: hypothetical protein AAF585_29050 [Verrucomicrobiota bacterium]
MSNSKIRNWVIVAAIVFISNFATWRLTTAHSEIVYRYQSARKHLAHELTDRHLSQSNQSKHEKRKAWRVEMNLRYLCEASGTAVHAAPKYTVNDVSVFSEQVFDIFPDASSRFGVSQDELTKILRHHYSPPGE